MVFSLNEFIEYYAQKNGTSKAEAKRSIVTFVDTYKACVVENGGVDLRGFIKSQVVDIPAKKVRNPKDGSIIDVPAKKAVKIKISSKFKNMED